MTFTIKTSQRENRALSSAEQKNRKEIVKGVWRMPRLSEAKKDVVSCEKLRGLAHTK